MIDRISVRRRPAGWPALHQRWSRLLFLHWRFAPDVVRAVVPAGLEIDVFDGDAWVGVTPFTVSRMRPSLLPPLPFVSATSEINLRIYVHRDGVPGIWFPSLDASNPLAVWAARLAYRLPYYRASMRVREQGGTVSFHSRRTHAKAPAATFDAAWQAEGDVSQATPGSLDDFLLERYVLYSGDHARLLRARIHHRPWPLRNARLLHLDATLLQAAGLPARSDAPLVHAQAEPFDMAAWLPMPA